MRRKRANSEADVSAGAVAAEALHGEFPEMKLPIQPPYAPMEAKLVSEMPKGGGWQYEPKWDGFRCLAFRDGDTVAMQSKSGQPLGRYFPELMHALAALPVRRFALDGEIVIFEQGRLAFDELLQRIHPAASRIRKLSVETPGTLLVFDLLVDARGKLLTQEPLSSRRERLEQFFEAFGAEKSRSIRLSPASTELRTATRWMEKLAGEGLEGIVAKKLELRYESGERAMLKVKQIRTADCVVGGFRMTTKGGGVGSLLLGLYGDDGKLHHVGFTSSFNTEQRVKLIKILEPYRGGAGFSGNAPGGPSRWSTERSGEWEPLDPKLVCEVRFDHFSGGRFRHGTKFLRWRPEKQPKACRFDQVVHPSGVGGAVERLLAA
ncbi:MAG TPA: ATP-dependent DNA ligase [candidate division Zixibacteria bacterium]|nr:ATP-dependent DNA ligase [candidate division Zixibacteria bacterium]